jgi:hypothetical protein
MSPPVPEKMKAAAIDRFGGPEVFHTRLLPVPSPRTDEVLIRLGTAGTGSGIPMCGKAVSRSAKSHFRRS